MYPYFLTFATQPVGSMFVRGIENQVSKSFGMLPALQWFCKQVSQHVLNRAARTIYFSFLDPVCHDKVTYVEVFLSTSYLTAFSFLTAIWYSYYLDWLLLLVVFADLWQLKMSCPQHLAHNIIYCSQPCFSVAFCITCTYLLLQFSWICLYGF